MQGAVPKNKGSMAAILGLNFSQVSEIIHNYKLQKNIFIANDNADGQIVLSGLKEDIENSLDIFKENGARKAMKLSVSAPFHCPLMEPAQKIMKKSLTSVSYTHLTLPTTPYV